MATEVSPSAHAASMARPSCIPGVLDWLWLGGGSPVADFITVVAIIPAGAA
ncbi:MAG: hypothetical protein GX133_00715 [Syntrophomonadaceae bacterium]|nr:hypothetical protein [Syntrophomonadaceae bacterium]